MLRQRGRPIRPFQQRDLGPMLEVAGALERDGYTLGESTLNFPGKEGDTTRAKVSRDHFAPNDLVMMLTRPAISDAEHGDRKQLERGYTDLEDEIFALWLRYVELVARSHVRLVRPLWPLLEGPYATRRDMSFRSRGPGAYYRDWNAWEGEGWKKAPRNPHTAAFMLRVDELFPGGPGFLGIFGLDGTATLIWGWLLRHRRPDLLHHRGFTMVELRGGKIPKRPTDLNWIDAWKVEVLLQTP